MTPWTTIGYKAPLSMGFSRQEYWSRLPFPSPGDLPNSGIEPGSPALQADSEPSELPLESMIYSGIGISWKHSHSYQDSMVYGTGTKTEI